MKHLSTMLVFLLILSVASFSFGKDVQSQVQHEAAKSVITLSADKPVANPVEKRNVLINLRSDSLLWLEDYEAPNPGWFSIDETSPGEFFHLTSWNAYGGTGKSWWMADTTIGNDGGYLDSWYQVLDSDPINLTGTTAPTLTFYHRYKVEDPAGASPPYNGWDGMNVRVSTDGGTVWTVLQNPTPAYTATSLYSFGFEHGEGPNVPGWGGEQQAWIQVTIDLTAYAGQTVNLRFAFASDPGYSTADDPTMFAWQIDEIKVADGATVIFSNDGTNVGLTAKQNTAVGGDWWHIATDPTAPSPTHKADANDPATGTYHINMNNAYVSPWFWLPDTVTEAYFDFSLQGSYTDPDAFPDVDYFGAYIQVKGETAWRYISNITQDPNGNNYVYSSAPEFWATYSESYSSGLIDLATLLGDSIRVKFTFESDDDAPQGTAIQIDNVIVWTPPLNLPVPQDLAGTAGDGFVDLTWTDLNTAGHTSFIYDNDNFTNGIFTSSGTFDGGTMFTSPAPATIDTVWLYGYTSNTLNNVTVKVWDAATGTIGATPLYTKAVTLTPDVWNAVDVTADNWTVSGNFVAGLECGTFPTGAVYCPLDESAIPSSHSYVNLGGWSTWQSVAAANNLPDGEWGIRAAVTYAGTSNITYNVYRRLDVEPSYGSAIATGITTADYHDDTVTNGESYSYAVTAYYPGQGESGKSDEITGMKPQAATIYEYAHDDGSAETFYDVGAGNYVAVKFELMHWPQDLNKIKAYFDANNGGTQFKVWADDGANGMPGTELASISVNDITGGWYEKDINPITISAGSFYVGLRVAPTTPDLGLDQTAPVAGMSYFRLGTAGNWENLSALLNGDVMIRCYLDSAFTAVEDDMPQIIDEFVLEQNYPNPFNPTTNINFVIPTNMNNENVVLTVFDVLGREVATLVNEKMNAGVHTVQWNGMNASGAKVTSGIYLYTLKAGDVVQTKKMIMMK